MTMSSVEKGVGHIRILDGGSGTELHRMGHECIHKDPLWSSRLLHTRPDEIVKAHKNFLNAGSDLIITVTYQASVEGFQKYLGLSAEESLKLTASGVHLAKQACREVMTERGDTSMKTVAASVGPYGAILADMSEYTGIYAEKITTRELIEFHRPRVKALVEAGADLLAVETMPIQKEADAVLELLKEFPNTKAFVSFTCKNGNQIAHGETFSDAIRSAAQSDQIVAVGMNCTALHYITPLLKSVQHLNLVKPLLVKPNGCKECESNCGSRLGDYAKEWLELGAEWLGGCCRIYPSDIEDLRKVVLQTCTEMSSSVD